MDVSVLLRVGLDELCWTAVSAGRRAAAAFYHSGYGTVELAGRDFVESWFLATKPGNPFFVRWRDLFCELLRGRTEVGTMLRRTRRWTYSSQVHGLLDHPLYQGLSLEGLDRLNKEFSAADMDFREYLAIHAMCHRMLETLPEARAQWRDAWQLTDAAHTAFLVQAAAAAAGLPVAALLLGEGPVGAGALAALGGPPPLLKLRTPDHAALSGLPARALLDGRHLLGQLLSGAGGAAEGGDQRPCAPARAE
ncbi:unnamed protein product, partial [Prorocentrum cordatum]